MKGFLSTFIARLLLTSCNDIFDTHPYDIDFHSETGINARQIAKIESRFANKDTLRVAFISDTHGWYSDTKDEIADLNKRTDIDFVIHCGDLTDTGTSKGIWMRCFTLPLKTGQVLLALSHTVMR